MKQKSVLIAFLAFILSWCELSAQECPVLQYQHDRLYFPKGESENVYPDCRFTIFKGEDSVYSGLIEFSALGISYSRRTAGFFDTLPVDSFHAVVEPARVDSSATIRLGAVGYAPLAELILTDDFTEGVSAPAVTVLSDFGSEGAVRLLRYDSYFAMVLDFESGGLDGFFSHRRYESSNGGSHMISSPAPYFAALVPDVSRRARENEFLTTSLYYRLNQSKFAVMFDGDAVVPFNCLYGCDKTCLRTYPYDPERGRKLIRNTSQRGRSVSIRPTNEELQKAAVFFSDVLSRDRIRTGIIGEGNEADCYLVFVPIGCDSAGVTLRMLNRFLARDTVDGNSINQTIAVIGKYIELGRMAATDSSREHYFDLAQKSLLEDVSLFPLFRPTVYFRAHKHIKGYSFEPEGYFVADSLIKLVLPVQVPGRDR
jgi:hypothetical protein